MPPATPHLLLTVDAIIVAVALGAALTPRPSRPTHAARRRACYVVAGLVGAAAWVVLQVLPHLSG